MKIGDTVSVIDQDLEGIISTIHKGIVFFKDSYGFQYRFSKSELVVKDIAFYEDLKIEKKQESFSPSKSKKHNKNHLILDLHFDNLVKNPTDYSSFERLFIQKKKLLDTLDFCRNNHLKKLEIVHGIGDGTLQKMVSQVLNDQVDLEFHHMDVLHHQSGNILVFIV
jgi:hypothetical protein